MSRIKSQDTKPEILVRKFLHGKGLRYSLYNKNLPGKPDLCFKKYRKVLFINGCFWHGHEGCKYFKLPLTRTEWWKNKISLTTERDKIKNEELIRLGWEIIVVWECELKPAKRDETLNRIFTTIITGEKRNGQKK